MIDKQRKAGRKAKEKTIFNNIKMRDSIIIPASIDDLKSLHEHLGLVIEQKLRVEKEKREEEERQSQLSEELMAIAAEKNIDLNVLVQKIMDSKNTK